MPDTFNSPSAQLSLAPGDASWSVQFALGPALTGLRLGVSYFYRGHRHQALDTWELAGTPEQTTEITPHGLATQILLTTRPNSHGLRFRISFRLPNEQPLLLWRLEVQHAGERPVFLERFCLFSSGAIQLGAGWRPAFYANGWQSWSYTGLYGPQDTPLQTRLGFLRTPTENLTAGAAPGRGRFQAEMFGALANRTSRQGLLAGFLSQQEQFGTVQADLERPALQLLASGDRARLDPSAAAVSDWACLQAFQLDDPDPFAPYLEAVARQHQLPASLPVRPSPTGWCSWYYFSSEDYVGALTGRDLRQNLEAAHQMRPELSLEVFQIDDGFETRVGDWTDFTPGFPQGVAPLAGEIRQAGFTPGLWLAPFIVDRRSRLAARHPEWLLRDAAHRPVNAGYLWGAFATALDLTIPDALQFAVDTIAMAVHDWGFPYLKLDFLYAAALPGRFQDPTRTRASVLRAGLQAVRQAAGEQAFLLGCGCPLGPAIGLVDAMRIGADTARRWRPAFKNIERPLRREPNLPSARSAALSALTRAPLHQRWWINDPDCLLLREDTRLTLAEVQTIATAIALTGGSLLLSDHLPGLAPARRAIAERLLPLIGHRPTLPGLFDSDLPERLRLDLENQTGTWSLLAAFNWDDHPAQIQLRPADFQLPEAEYWAHEFWREVAFEFGRQTTQAAPLEIPPHGCLFLAVRPKSSAPQWLGSNLHSSQGFEVTGWESRWPGPDQPGQVAITMERPGTAEGEFWLYLPGPLIGASLNGQPLTGQSQGQGLIRFPVRFDQRAEVLIQWSSPPEPATGL